MSQSSLDFVSRQLGGAFANIVAYESDLSGSFVDRSLVDKAYVDSEIASVTFALTNGSGTTANGTAVDLGGTLSSAITIDGETGHSMLFTSHNTNSSSFDFRGSLEIAAGFVELQVLDGDGTGGIEGALGINISTTSMLVTDSVNSLGLQYSADYSANFISRSLVDKAYVDTEISNAVTAAGNVYTTSGTVTGAREIFSENGTSVTFNGYDTTAADYTKNALVGISSTTSASMLALTGDGAGNWTGDASGAIFDTTTLLVLDQINNIGLVYESDYSANFVARSLVDKAYVDAQVAGVAVPSDTDGLTEGSTNLYNRVPAGGTANQVLAKVDGADYNLAWVDDADIGDTDSLAEGTTNLYNRIPTGGTAGQVLSKVDGADYNLAWVDDGTGESIYSIDGTITGSRAVTGETNGDIAFLFYDTSIADYTTRGGLTVAHDEVQISYGAGDGLGALTSLQAITLSGAFMTVTDGTNNKGLEYTADYSANFTDRSLVDKGYVDAEIAAAPSETTLYTGDGTLSGGTVRTVTGTQNSQIDFISYDLTSADYNEAGQISLGPAGVSLGALVGDGAGGVTSVAAVNFTALEGPTITNSVDGQGIRYAADYSAGYTARSLTDFAYANSHVFGQDGSSIALSPTATQDGFSLVWDNANTRWDLVEISIPTVDTLYTADGELTSTRTVSAPNSLGLTFFSFDTATAGAATEQALFNFQHNLVDLSVTDVTGGTDMRFEISEGSGMRVTDTTFSRGLLYAADYSANFTNESLVTKRYVDNEISGAGSGNIYSIDGALTGNRAVSMPAFNLDFVGTAGGQFVVNTYDSLTSDYTLRGNLDVVPGLTRMRASTGNGAGGDSTILNLDLNTAVGAIFTDTVNTRGLQYGADYSANFVDRSLVDKAYVDSEIAGIVFPSDNTIYNTDGVIDATSRFVEGNNFSAVNLFEFRVHDTTSADYNTRSFLIFQNDEVTIGANDGDGIGGNDHTTDIRFQSGGGARLRDSQGQGLYYADDYSVTGQSTHGDRWIPDRGYVDAAVAGVTSPVTSVNTLTGAVVLDPDDLDDAGTTNKFVTQTEIDKLAGIEANATADQTGAEVVSLLNTELGGTTWQTDTVPDTFYTADGSINSVTRTLSGIGNAAVRFHSYDSTALDYLAFSRAEFAPTEVLIGIDAGAGSGSSTSEKSIAITPTAMTVLDSTNSIGLVYAADYSANFTNRSLVDKAYVDNEISAAGDGNIYTQNGQIDGVLRAAEGINNAIWTFATYDVTAGDYTTTSGSSVGPNSVSFYAGTGDGLGGATSVTSLALAAAGGITVADGGGEGIAYAADYSGSQTAGDRWITDKGYVDGAITTAIAGIPATDTLYTADGGWTGGRNVEADTNGFLILSAYDATGADYTRLSQLNVTNNNLVLRRANGDGTGGNTDQVQIAVTGNGVEVTDTTNSLGAFYSADYSANFVDRSLVDKAYVDTAVAGATDTSIYSADGTLTSNRQVTANNSFLRWFSYDTSAADYTRRGRFDITNSSILLQYSVGDGAGGGTGAVRQFEVQNGGMVATDSVDGHGIEYAADYSGTFVDRSLVDKGYVDSTVAGVPTFYNSDATFSGSRNVFADTSGQINLYSFDTTSTTFNSRANVLIRDGASLDYYTGDGAGNDTARVGVGVGSSSIVLIDSVNSTGALYDADYSANFVDRSLVDKAYVDGEVAGVPTILNTQSIDSGLNQQLNYNVGRFLRLISRNFGDTDWTEQSRVTVQNGFAFLSSFSGDGAGATTGTSEIVVSNAGMNVTDTINNIGLQYSADYSANFVDRSLVDKAYVDAAVSGGGSSDRLQDADNDTFISLETEDTILMQLGENASDYNTPASGHVNITNALMAFEASAGTQGSDPGGSISFRAGDGNAAASTSSNNATGGDITFRAGDGFGSIGSGNDGGSITFTAGGSGSGGSPGQILLETQVSTNPASIVLAPANDSVGADHGTVNLIRPNANTTPVQLRFYEGGAGLNYIGLETPSGISADVDYVLPIAPTTNGQVLSSTTAGVMSWVDLPTTPDTFYTADGILTSNRSIQSNSGTQIQFNFWDTDVSTYNSRMFLQMNHDIFRLVQSTGDGSGGQTTLNKEIRIDPTQFLIRDADQSLGMVYAADYSSNFVARSIVDKGYVDGQVAGFLPLSGGTMTGDATFDGDAFISMENGTTVGMQFGIGAGTNVVAFDVSANFDLEFIQEAGTGQIVFDAATNSEFRSVAQYDNDKSGSFTDRSLVDKAYVDNKAKQSKSISVIDPQDGDNITMFYTSDAITVSNIQAVVYNGLTSCNINPRHTLSRSAGTTGIIAEAAQTITNTTTGQSFTSFADGTIPANSWVTLILTGPVGSGEVHVTIEYTVD